MMHEAGLRNGSGSLIQPLAAISIQLLDFFKQKHGDYALHLFYYFNVWNYL